MRILVATLFLAAAPAGAVEFRFPVDCVVGADCAIQHYVDRDPGPDARDFRCGVQTYDGHDGTDIRVPTLRDMAAGVAVLAAADGVVARTRDGMADRIVTDGGVADGRDCGNGVVIGHPGGFETQYCHMKEGSVGVSPGDRVTAGTPIGAIGLSGNTEFPHLHFTVRRDGDPVDPFSLAAAVSGDTCTPGGGERLWTDEAAAVLGYRPAAVLNVGFADFPPAMEDVESGVPEERRPRRDAGALVFFGRAIGLDAGDRQRLAVLGPDGAVFAEDEVEPLDRPKAQYFAFVGKRRSDPARPWPPGTYQGRYSVIRGGEEIAIGTAELRIAGDGAD